MLGASWLRASLGKFGSRLGPERIEASKVKLEQIERSQFCEKVKRAWVRNKAEVIDFCADSCILGVSFLVDYKPNPARGEEIM